MTDPGDRPRSKTETFEIAIGGLLTKRADTLGELLRLRAQIIEVESDILALDRVLTSLGYHGELEAVPPRQLRDAPFGRGQVMRAILDCLREAGKPLTVREIAEASQSALGFDKDDVLPMDGLKRRVSKALGRLKRDRAVVSAADTLGVMRWSLMADAAAIGS